MPTYDFIVGKQVLSMRKRVVVGAVSVAAVGLSAWAGNVREEASGGTWPFAILRSYGAYAENPLFTERVFAAQERHPGLFGEIWFCGDGGLDFTAEERGRLAAEKNAGIRERCHKLGIAFSFQQGVTLNHGADGLKRGFIPEDAWAVNRDGRTEYGILCCTSPWALDYQRETAKAIMGRLQPDSYWPDDDLRLSKGDRSVACFCFCDRCVKLFSDSFGQAFTRETLAKALNGPNASADVRRAWSAFNGRNLGACAKVYREAADAVSPKTRLGIQIALSGNTVDGDSWRTMVRSLAGEGGRAGTRPGGLYYTDFNPHELPAKMVLVAREAARSGALPEIGQICYEVENWPHVGGNKNAHAMMAECAWALAVGCDSIAFYWGADQNGEDAASHDYWLESVWAWRPFHLAVRDAFAGTRLGGVAAYHGADHWATKDWASHDEKDASALMACGVPVTVTEAAPDAFWLNERCVGTLAEGDLKDVFARPVVMSAAAFAALAKRFPKLGFTQKLKIEFTGAERALATVKRANGYELFPSGLKSANVKAYILPKAADVKPFSAMTADDKACGTCVVPTEFGGKVVVAQEVPAHWPHAVWPGCRRHAVLDALDAATPGGQSARLLTDGYAVAVSVRKTADGRTAGVFLFNLGLGETPPLELAIRRGAGTAWRVSSPRQPESSAEVVRATGDEIVVRVPPMQAYGAALVGGPRGKTQCQWTMRGQFPMILSSTSASILR